jgi:hypothetical protein
MRRRPKHDRVLLDSLHVPEFERDSEFLRLYGAFMGARITGGVTRISSARVQVGFWRALENRLIVDEIKQDDVQLMRTQIRAGARPILYVYRVAGLPGGELVCPDDTVALTAYRAESIDTVPCLVLAPDSSILEHSAFVVKTLPTAPDRPMAIIGTMAPDEPRLARILGDGAEHGEIEADFGLRQLEAQTSYALRRLRHFHLQGAASTHYHHSLASALTRGARLVGALRRIGMVSYPDAAAVVTRSLYELWLSVYLDWLAPELVGPGFQIHATSTRRSRKKAMEILSRQMLANGWNKQDVERLNGGRERLFRIIESPTERARVNPGAILHDEIYSRLCQFAHQDFAAGSPFLTSLRRKESPARFKPENNELHARFLLQVSDIAVSGIVACVSSDTGVSVAK